MNQKKILDSTTSLDNSTQKKINKHRINLIWLNARIDAVDFYKKCGFSIIGKKFRLEYGGEHFKMIKKL